VNNPHSDPPGTAARRAALRLLIAVLWQGRALEAAQDQALGGLAPADRGLARLIAGTVLRWLPDLDDLVDGATAKRLPDDARARMVLRIALAQAIRLGTPHHAVVATALPLVESGPRRLVHGVLSRLLREGATLPEAPRLPDFFAARWMGRYDLDGLGEALGSEPPTDLSHKSGAVLPDGESLAPGHLRTAAKGSVADWPGFAEGGWWVQDLAASLPVRLLGDVAGKRVADLCAAPGGKTMQLAAARAEVIAVDSDARRMERVRDNLARTRLAAETVVADASVWVPSAPLDHVLLDAPCSATGIFRRHPDVLHLASAKNIRALAETQARLLDHAVGLVPRHGRLIYCTCSLEPEEGERQIAALNDRFANVRVDPVAAHELPHGLAPAPEGWVRTVPGDLDGFFIARLAVG
jgi:16S rRNA (cytosine967-C5)-methyltransferase